MPGLVFVEAVYTSPAAVFFYKNGADANTPPFPLPPALASARGGVQTVGERTVYSQDKQTTRSSSGQTGGTNSIMNKPKFNDRF